MIIYLAGAESAKYQEALLRTGGPSLQTFYAQRAIHEIFRMRAELNEEKEPKQCLTSSAKPS